jgi:PAS domain S-box-containing protein
MGDREALRLNALKSFGVLDTQADAAIDRLARLAGNLFDTRFAQYPAVTGPPHVRFYAAAALTTKDGHNLGTLCVIDDKPRPRPDDTALDQLKLLARIVVDEFELAKAHRQTRERQRLLEIAETMAGVGHWRLDLASGAVTWSDAVYAIHGVDRATFDPNLDDAVAFYHPDDRDLVRGHLNAALEAGASFEFQLRLVRADGTLRHVVSRGVCEIGDQGRPTAMFGLFQDVTETVETIRGLQRRKSRYRLVTEHAGDVITCYDFSGGGAFISPAIEKLFGYTVPETVGQTAPEMLHPDDRDAVVSVFADMARGLEQRTIQHRSRHRRGHYVWVESNLQLVRDGQGAPQEIVSISRDISDRKALAGGARDEFGGGVNLERRARVNCGRWIATWN